MSRIYKEGQGKWARGLLVMVIVVAAWLALDQLHGFFPEPTGEGFRLPILGFPVDYRSVIVGLLLLASLYFAYWMFNRPKTVDFLIETEAELKNKVTWPSQKEEVSSSVVVIVTVFVIGTFVAVLDLVFGMARDFWYG